MALIEKSMFSYLKQKIDDSTVLISETKIDDSTPIMQFRIERYCVFRLDKNEYEGSILVYVREDVPSKLIPMKKYSTEAFYIQLNLRRKK